MTILARRKLLTQIRDLDAYLGVVVAKNCGTGPGGFQPGNTCASTRNRNSAAGSKRRRKAGKRRRTRGPNSGVGAKTRAARRQNRGVNRQAQREWELRSEKPHADPEHRSLADSHLEGRRDLADSIRAEREDHHESIRSARQELAQTIRSERADNELERRRDRGDMRRRQRREAASLEASQARQFERLEAYHGRQLSRSQHPERLAPRQAADRERIAEQHRDGLADLRDTHGAERGELRREQREARETEREDWRSQIEDRNAEDRSERFEKHREWREQLHELHQEQRRERLEFEREARRAKSYSWVDAKATPDDGVPGAQAILTNALVATGHTEAWEDWTLSGRDALDVLHAVRLEGCQWLREQAQSLFDAIGEHTEKALVGDAKAKVKGFFAKARKHIKSLFLAGVLSIAGPKQDLGQEAVQALLNNQVEQQHEYLAGFEQEILAETKPVDARFVARAESYGASVWGAATNIERDLGRIARPTPTSKDPIFAFESRHHYGVDDRDLCPTCARTRFEHLGIVPIGTLPSIGDSECLIRCHCAFSFYETEDGAEYTTIFAGRGPMHFPTFGVTGVSHNW